MTNLRCIYLIDSDSRRRAGITHCLSGSGIHVEPFESAAELLARWPNDGLILAYDQAHTITALVDHMGETGSWLPLVVFADQPTTRQVVEAIMAGAIDYVALPLARAEFLDVAREADRRATELKPVKLREITARGRIARLTRREREVLAGVVDGLSNRLIGERLAISPRTVEIHRSNMLTKMGAVHTADAIRWACEAGLS